MTIKAADLKRATKTRLRPLLRNPGAVSPKALKCRRKFLRFFPGGFSDETYLDWERNYKWGAYERWCAVLRRNSFRSLIDSGDYEGVARHAVTIESRTNLLFSFEKMALRDAVRSREGAQAFAEGLWHFLHGTGTDQERFEKWVEVIADLPRKQTRVLTWPIATIFGFISQPEKHVFLKPLVTRASAEEYGFDLHYESRPNWRTYVSLLEFAEQVREDQRDLGPRDMIDLQSFIWLQGSDEYEE
ncbi:MAG: hypothetical protein WD825_14300 [Gemmatimonadaceae bacterium]